MEDGKKCSCIIPFYNEEFENIVGVVEKISQVKNIAEILCVDDGSESRVVINALKKKFPKIIAVIREKNGGKSAAVKSGLDQVKTRYVVLIDSDLQHLVSIEIERAVDSIVKNEAVDMVILKRVSEPWYFKMLRWDILISGERILRSDDLRKAFLKNPKGYQLEYAINSYMMENKKKAYWAPSKGANVYKIYKMGFFKGLSRDIAIHYDLIKYLGWVFPIKSFLFFCRRKVKMAN